MGLHPHSVPWPGNSIICLSGGVWFLAQHSKYVWQARLVNIVLVLNVIVDSQRVHTTHSACNALEGVGAGSVIFVRADSIIGL